MMRVYVTHNKTYHPTIFVRGKCFSFHFVLSYKIQIRRERVCQGVGVVPATIGEKNKKNLSVYIY